MLLRTRADLEEAWGVTVHNEWVCTEGASAATCGTSQGLHLSADWLSSSPSMPSAALSRHAGILD
jgi:phenylacetate-coenzyme A ligase PaaK-like adenylate-forming protein